MLGSQLVETKFVNGKEVEVVGCYDTDDGDIDEDGFDFYDLFVDGECINPGEPLWSYPTKEDIEVFVD